MGIPYYFSYLIKNHPKIIENFYSNEIIDYLFIDSNSIIYDAIHNINSNNLSHADFEKLIIYNVIEKLVNIIHSIKSLKNVFITFDGVPPFAKLKQQKNRRYKSQYQSKILNKNLNWDSCAITPGTLFMDKLNDSITNYFKNNKISPNILLNLSDQPGEGEHKIFNYIRNNFNNLNSNIIIYGLDSDLIMLSLNHLKYTKNIYLYRETPHFINSLDSSLNPNEKYLINIFELGKQIFKELTNTEFADHEYDTPDWLNEASNILQTNILSKQNTYKLLFHDKILDYIFICFLLGNDFMPHFSAINIRINGFTIILDLYKSLFGIDKNLLCNNNISWKNFKKFIKKISDNEVLFIKEIYTIREKISKKFNPDQSLEDKLINLPSKERNIEKFINPYEDGWEFRYYYSLFNINIDNDQSAVNKICNNYLLTLKWTLEYYTGDCNNWIHYYKYDYAPLLIDLVKYIPYFDSELTLEKNNTIIHPYLLLSYVLPKNSLNLLPKKIHNYLLKNYENHYKDDYEILYAFCKYFWEGHVKFPELDFKKFSEDINLLI